MNKVLEPLVAGKSAAARSLEQAGALRGVLMSLGRNLLSMDDLTVDLPIRQLRICLALYHHSGSMSEISREVGVSLSAMTQVADRLERAGLVERVFQGPDRRVRHLQLTDRGQQLMRHHEEAQLHRMAGLLERLSKKQVSDTLQALHVLVEASGPKEKDSASP
jgi:DNA-binding MarR family transcriptional regulator